jgi:Holliday junction resolvasome RuvABC endonuclease subunit
MGLDVSLRGTGWCVLPKEWQPGSWWSVKSGRLTEEGALEGMPRVEAAVKAVTERVVVYGVSAVFVEQYAFSFSTNGITRVAELLGALRYELWKLDGIEVVPVVASSARKTLFGKLPRMVRKEIKQHVEHELGKMGAPKEWSEDERDAFCIANHGRLVLTLPCLMQA